MSDEFTTELGCTVSLHPAPEHLSPGWLLCLDMRGDGDRRHAEVFLNEGNAQSLRSLLGDALALNDGGSDES